MYGLYCMALIALTMCCELDTRRCFKEWILSRTFSLATPPASCRFCGWVL
ncbi:hypothetical protein KC19_VG152300 [Ceratodon purpureus]|uniref:Uncharacterized protein n=1 Tax=Ceratodon purpureus TaxID=3225 RepID=A0A8T0HQM1_CERPU|nr:hypothetical protein KC19_VG152300 [Ceratodon purpureus]